MIGLAANLRPFFMRVNSDAAEFTPHLNKINGRGWISLREDFRISIEDHIQQVRSGIFSVSNAGSVSTLV